MIEIDMVPAPIIQVKFDGTVICANQHAEAVFKKKLAGKSIGNLIRRLDTTSIGKLSGKQPIRIIAKVRDETYQFTLQKDPGTRSFYIIGCNLSELMGAHKGQLKNQREKLEKRVGLRTGKLERVTEEMEQTQLALTYLMEDVNESREEIEKANLLLINEIRERMLREKELKTKTRQLNLSLIEIESAKDKIDGILKSITDGIVVTDLEKRIVLINEIAQKLFRVDLNQAIDEPLESVIMDPHIYEKFNVSRHELENGYNFDFELFNDREENPRIFNAIAAIIRNKMSDPIGIITVFRDVTQQKELDRMKSEFISTTAHELRTPLTSIQGFAEILLSRKNLEPYDTQKFLNYILNQAKRLSRIISNLLNISRIESGLGIILQKEPCFVGDMIRRIVSNFDSKSSNHVFMVSIKEESKNLFADSEKIEQVIVNLIANALNYSPKGSKIYIEAMQMKGQYWVTVEDQGIGMTPEQVKRVFDKFYRVDASNSTVEGTGLGMSIVKNNIDAHGGRVWVESKLHEGTKVTFVLPLVPDRGK